MKTVIIYYSLEWNTEFVAKQIQNKFDWNLFKLIPDTEIKKDSFTKYLWWWKQVVMKEKPKLLNEKINIENYDLIFLWTPVWAFDFTPALRTFFDEYLIKNKKIILFCTHEWWPGKTLNNMESCLDWNAILGKIDFNRKKLNTSELLIVEIDNWLKNIKEKL